MNARFVLASAVLVLEVGCGGALRAENVAEQPDEREAERFLGAPAPALARPTRSVKSAPGRSADAVARTRSGGP